MNPSVVVGFGGYPSFPAVAVAQCMNIPTVIHEQNAVLGQVNRMLSKKTKCLALSFEHTERVDSKSVVKVVGTPVRDAFYGFRETKYSKLKPSDPVHLLITGGSQGAKVFSTIIPTAIAALSPETRDRITVLHQCPKDDVDSLKKTYEGLSINAEVVGFIENMAEEISKAHLVIARSGASTLAELAVIGRPAILVPFPGAKDDHQWVNAKHIQAAEAGWCVRQADFSDEYLTEKIHELLKEPKLLYDAALRMKDLGCITAAEEIVDLIETHINKEV
jgi:UDP-N-acetylglucosamine--N-acetylmuramyl-(pentapeptide) pyrophosphoryl-undecaprenol N-acetylglucosamine transferase